MIRTKRFFLSAVIITLLAGSPALVGKGVDKKTLKYWAGRGLQACTAASLIVYLVKRYKKDSWEAVLTKICAHGGTLAIGGLLADS